MGKSRKSNIAALSAVLPDAGDMKRNNAAKKIFLVCLCTVLVLLIIYMTYFPIPIYEEAEGKVENAASMKEIDMSLLDDPGAVSEEHRKWIEKTQAMYRQRREEIADMIRTGSITDDAIAKCQSKIENGDFGPAAVLNSFTWYIPESSAELDLGLSAQEADKVLYLYSCIKDMNFFNGREDTFEKWFYGIEGSIATYPVEMDGKIYYLNGRAGYYLPLPLLQQTEREAKAAGAAAVKDKALEQLASQGILMRALTFLAKPFIHTAYSEDDEGFMSAYNNYWNNVLGSQGTAFVDTAIYTGISSQTKETISFHIEKEPAPVWPGGKKFWEGTIEEYEGNEEVQAIVKRYAEMPFLGRIQIDMTAEKEGPTLCDEQYEDVERSGTEPGYTKREWKKVYDYELKKYVYKWVYTAIPDKEISWTETVKKSDTFKEEFRYTIRLQAFNSVELVDFVGRVNITGTSIAGAERQLQSLMYGNGYEAGEGADYRVGRNDEWCAWYASWFFEQLGITDNDYYSLPMDTAYDFLMNEMGLNRAAASGIITNFLFESGMKPNAVGDYGTSYGLCQWHNERWTDLKNYAEACGKPIDELETQLGFFRYEVETKYPELLEMMRSVSDDEESAYQVAYCMCSAFERPADTEGQSLSRGYAAKDTYNAETSGDVLLLHNYLTLDKGTVGKGDVEREALGLKETAFSRVSQFGSDDPDAYEAKIGDVVISKDFRKLGVVVDVSPYSVIVSSGNASDSMKWTEITNPEKQGLAGATIIHNEIPELTQVGGLLR